MGCLSDGCLRVNKGQPFRLEKVSCKLRAPENKSYKKYSLHARKTIGKCLSLKGKKVLSVSCSLLERA